MWPANRAYTASLDLRTNGFGTLHLHSQADFIISVSFLSFTSFYDESSANSLTKHTCLHRYGLSTKPITFCANAPPVHVALSLERDQPFLVASLSMRFAEAYCRALTRTSPNFRKGSSRAEVFASQPTRTPRRPERVDSSGNRKAPPIGRVVHPLLTTLVVWLRSSIDA